MWALSLLLIGALALAVVVLYGLDTSGLSDGVVPSPEIREALVIGLCGMVVLFCLYILYKQAQMNRLREQLIEALLREERLQSRLSGQSSLFESIADAGTQLDLEPVLQSLAHQVRSFLGAERCSIMLLDEQTGELYCPEVSGLDADLIRDIRIKLGQGISGWVAQNNEPLVLNDDETVLRFASELASRRPIVSALSVPVAVREHVIGVLNISRVESGPPFTPEDARLVTMFAAHMALVIKSIMEMREAQEDQLRQLQKMEALGRLAGGVAHDFNNLLQVIKSYGYLALDELPELSAVRDDVREMLNAADRAAALTRQLLAFGRKQVVAPSVVDLNALVAEVNTMLPRLIGEDIVLRAVLDPSLGPIRVDPGQISQVIINLAVNARDAMPMGGRLTIETRNVRLNELYSSRHVAIPPGSYVMLALADAGIGMDPKTQAHIFEPFFTTKEQGKGTGLGLSTVYGIVKQSGGYIWVYSEEGRGTTFKIYFPRVDEAVDLVQEPFGVERLDGTETVLLVEDEDALRVPVSKTLKAKGYTVLEAGGPEDALLVAQAHEGPIDLLLTDVIMPGMSGCELARRIVAMRPGTNVLYMSGYSDEAIANHGVLEPSFDLLQKPFSHGDLLSMVRRQMDRASTAAASPAAG